MHIKSLLEPWSSPINQAISESSSDLLIVPQPTQTTGGCFFWSQPIVQLVRFCKLEMWADHNTLAASVWLRLKVIVQLVRVWKIEDVGRWLMYWLHLHRWSMGYNKFEICLNPWVCNLRLGFINVQLPWQINNFQECGWRVRISLSRIEPYLSMLEQKATKVNMRVLTLSFNCSKKVCWRNFLF
jgi:hypothetical protein